MTESPNPKPVPKPSDPRLTRPEWRAIAPDETPPVFATGLHEEEVGESVVDPTATEEGAS